MKGGNITFNKRLNKDVLFNKKLNKDVLILEEIEIDDEKWYTFLVINDDCTFGDLDSDNADCFTDSNNTYTLTKSDKSILNSVIKDGHDGC